MRRTGLRLAALFAAIALCACGHTIQPTNYPTPFRGEFPVPHGPDYGAPYDQSYGDPNYSGGGAYGYDQGGYDQGGYEERGYAAPQDYRWYSGGEYRGGERRSGGYEYREYREQAPPRREYAPPRRKYAPRSEYAPSHGGYGESFQAEGYAHAKDGAALGHDFRYTYKYKMRDRIIKLDRYHLKRVESAGYPARPAARAYSYAEKTVRYEKKEVRELRPKKVVRAKVKVRKERRAVKKPAAKPCTCTEDKRVEDLRGSVKDERVTVEPFGKGYRLELPADILFALNSDALKPEAQAIIRNMAGGLRAEKGAEIDVHGYADTSGSDEHNDILSQARAVAVADALVREGVDPVVLTPRGFGESFPRVVTPDGVREPRNRRVEILVVPAQS